MTSRDGSTLVEVMMGLIILTVIAIGTAAYLYYSRATMRIQRSRRIALAAVNGRLEEIRGSDYDVVAPPSDDFDVHFLSLGGTNWAHSLSDPGETVEIEGGDFPIATTVQFVDADGVPASYDLVRVGVKSGYRLGSPERVYVQTILAP